MRKGVYYPSSFTKYAKSKSCNNGEYTCIPPKECCNYKLGCCNPHSPQHVFFWHHWYFWCSIFFVLVVFCVCGCGMWRRGRVRRPSDPRTPSTIPRASSYTSWCQPPQYSRCSSFLLPPPYSEVTAKPELYPLVLSYNMEGNKIANGSYYVVQQFRNYLINPLSTLSVTSNVETLGSNLLDDTISDTNPAPPPSYTLIPDNSIRAQNAMQTSASLLENIAGQSIPEEEGEGDKTRTAGDATPLLTTGPQLFTTRPQVFTTGPQLIAQFNANVSRFGSKHKRFSSIVIAPEQSTQANTRRSISAPPTPSNAIPQFPSSASENSEHPVTSTFFELPPCSVITKEPVAPSRINFEPPTQSVSGHSEHTVFQSTVQSHLAQNMNESIVPGLSEHTVNQLTPDIVVVEQAERSVPLCNIITVHPVASEVSEHTRVDL